MILFSLIQTLAWLALATVVSTFWQAVIAQASINISTGFINVIGEAIMVEISNDGDDEEDGESREKNGSKASDYVSEYLSLTALSMLINQYLGGYLLSFPQITVRVIFAISAAFPSITLRAGFYLQEKKTNVFQSQLVDREDLGRNNSFLQ